jgi:hypothetical protein
MISSALLSAGADTIPSIEYTYSPKTTLNPISLKNCTLAFIIAASMGLPGVTNPIVSPLCKTGGLMAIFFAPQYSYYFYIYDGNFF